MYFASCGLTIAILARLILFLLSFVWTRVCSATIFIEVFVVLCHSALPVMPLPQDRIYMQEITRLLTFQFICYNWHYALGSTLLFGELCVMTFILEPLMHIDPN